MKTMTFDPFRELTAVGEELDRFINRTLSPEPGGARSWTPPLDIHEGSDAIELTLELPGLARDQVEVEFEDGVLSISGERAYARPADAEAYRRVERSYGRFSRSIKLPQAVVPGGIVAAMADGLLTVTVPKADEAKPHKIVIGDTPVVEADAAV